MPAVYGPANGSWKPLEERFWEKVNKDGPLWNGTHCYVWMGGTGQGGYGAFWIGRKATKTHRKVKAHRVAYELLLGPIPEGLEIDHLCRNRVCVNPTHLEAVTHQLNVLRGQGRAAINAQRTYCTQGHPYDLINTEIYDGRRYCRACRRN